MPPGSARAGADIASAEALSSRPIRLAGSGTAPAYIAARDGAHPGQNHGDAGARRLVLRVAYKNTVNIADMIAWAFADGAQIHMSDLLHAGRG